MYNTILAANNKGADQTAQMRRLICAFVDRICINRFSHDKAHIWSAIEVELQARLILMAEPLKTEFCPSEDKNQII